MWQSVIMRPQVQLSTVAIVYHCQLSLPSLQGWLMSTSWGVNRHTMWCNSAMSVKCAINLIFYKNISRKIYIQPVSDIKLCLKGLNQIAVLFTYSHAKKSKQCEQDYIIAATNCHIQTVSSNIRQYTVSPKKHVTTFSTITLTISVRLQ